MKIKAGKSKSSDLERSIVHLEKRELKGKKKTIKGTTELNHPKLLDIYAKMAIANAIRIAILIRSMFF